MNRPLAEERHPLHSASQWLRRLWQIDLRSPLGIAGVYSTFQRLVGGNCRQRFVSDYVRPRPGDRILDIGCGPADILDYLPTASEYVGFDLSSKYIAAAQRRHGHRGQFLCQSVSTNIAEQFGEFDLVLAHGIIHHLDDTEATQLFRLAEIALKPTGRLVTLDGCYVPGQARLARQMLSWDRGRYVRWQSEYEQLARQVFPRVTVDIRNNLIRIPYTHIILECCGSAARNDNDNSREMSG